MKPTGTPRRKDLDLLKGLAILAVVLYHMGISRSGYLGVDVFFVISGFLVVPRVVREAAAGRFRYFRFLERRATRLLPLLLAASAFCLLTGYLVMLPDDYENLSESVVATNFFSNNILAFITTRNYWNPSNEYRALMHTWFVGVLFEFYVVFPLIVMAVRKATAKRGSGFMRYVVPTTLALTVVSFLLYLNPTIGPGDKFYLLPYRFHELSLGGLAGLLVARRGGRLFRSGAWGSVCFALLVLTVFFGAVAVGTRTAGCNLVTGLEMEGDGLIPKNVLQTAVVLLTAFLLLSDNMRGKTVRALVGMKVFGLLGAMSYSLFVWHQPFLAFSRYCISDEMTAAGTLAFSALVLAVAGLSWRTVEKRVRPGWRTRIVAGAAFILINGAAFSVYLHAGVVRDVPELDVRRTDAHRGMSAEYNDRIYAYDKGFPADNGKINVLVVGNSFSRDWGNILLESEVADGINLSYAPQADEGLAERIGRSDYVFVFGSRQDVPRLVWENLKPEAEVWGLGPKSYGTCNGIIYRHRHEPDYYDQSVRINPNFFLLNDRLKSEWKDKYVDLLGLSVKADGSVPVFSEDRKFLSQDCRHLTRAGARHYAALIDFGRIFRK